MLFRLKIRPGHSHHIQSHKENVMDTNTPKNVPQSVPIPDESTFDEFLEWTVEEEEAFLKILNDPMNDGIA